MLLVLGKALKLLLSKQKPVINNSVQLGTDISGLGHDFFKVRV